MDIDKVVWASAFWKPGQYIFGALTSKGDLDQFFEPPTSKSYFQRPMMEPNLFA